MATHSVTVQLPEDAYRVIQRSIDSGEYASESDVIAAALAAQDEDLHAKEDAIEAWLRETVIPIALRMEANPNEGFTGDEVLAHLQDDLRLLEKQANGL